MESQNAAAATNHTALRRLLTGQLECLLFILPAVQNLQSLFNRHGFQQPAANRTSNGSILSDDHGSAAMPWHGTGSVLYRYEYKGLFRFLKELHYML